jgi:branched-chain amino acid transport system ATP-binding protein
MLTVEQLNAGYHSSEVLHNVSLTLQEGEVVTLLGRNGMGKSTTINCICGLLAVRAGSIYFDQQALHRMPSYQIARLGVGLVPEQRLIFPNLDVRENLLVAAANYSGNKNPWDLSRIYELFPRLEERSHHAGSHLSGGEQQMLAIARALMINPRLLILDEATEGLAPLICEEIWQVIRHLKEQGQSILVVDKNLDTLLQIADRYYIMEKGTVVDSGASQELIGDIDKQARYLGV